MLGYTPQQKSFRGRGDSVGLNTGTWDHALNTGWTQDVDTVFRVRFSIQETGGSTGSAGGVDVFRVTFNIDGGSYTAVTGTTAVQWALSGQYANGDATSKLLDGTGSFDAIGFGTENTNNIVPARHGQGNNFENEWALLLDSGQLSDGQVIGLRLQLNSADFSGGYANTPAITVQEAAAGGGGGPLSMLLLGAGL